MVKSAVVIGGGIAGITTSIALAEKGIKVTCVEANKDVALETSFMNGSLVCSSLTQPWCNYGNLTGTMKELIFTSKDNRSVCVKWEKVLLDGRFWYWIAHFVYSSISSAQFDRIYKTSYELSKYSHYCLENMKGLKYEKGNANGTLQLFASVEVKENQQEIQSKIIRELRSIDIDDVPSLEPVLSDKSRYRGGVFHSRADRSLDIHKLCRSLKDKAKSLKVEFIMESTVMPSNIVLKKNKKDTSLKTIEYIQLTDGTKLQADIYIAANGNFSNEISERVGDGRHSWPVKGYALEVPLNDKNGKIPKMLKYNVVDDLNRVYIAPLKKTVRLSGFCEFGSAYPPHPNNNDHTNNKEDIKKAIQILKSAYKLLPKGYLMELSTDSTGEVSSDTIEKLKIHSCWRPQTPDDLPVIGLSSHVTNLYYNSGHGHLGLTRAIGSSYILANIIVPNVLKDKKEVSTDKQKFHIDVALLNPKRFHYTYVGNSMRNYLMRTIWKFVYD